MKRNPTFLIGLVVAMLGMLVATMSLTNGLMMHAAYAKEGKVAKYCFDYSFGPETGTQCGHSVGDCKKHEQEVIADQGTITKSCYKI